MENFHIGNIPIRPLKKGKEIAICSTIWPTLRGAQLEFKSRSPFFCKINFDKAKQNLPTLKKKASYFYLFSGVFPTSMTKAE